MTETEDRAARERPREGRSCASPTAVEAAMKAMGCLHQPNLNRCARHEFVTWDGDWTDRGCPEDGYLEAGSAERPSEGVL